MGFSVETRDAFAQARCTRLGDFYDLAHQQVIDLQGVGKYRIMSANTAYIPAIRGLVGERVGEGDSPKNVFIKSMTPSEEREPAALAAFFREMEINRAFAGSGVRAPEV